MKIVKNDEGYYIEVDTSEQKRAYNGKLFSSMCVSKKTFEDALLASDILPFETCEDTQRQGMLMLYATPDAAHDD